MTRSELRRFQAALTARIAVLERPVRHREVITIERNADQVEEIQRASERAIAVTNLDREFDELRNARAALGRIEEGSFGICQQCDQEIHPKRLAAIPWAPFCILCQEALDRNPDAMNTRTRQFLADAA